MGCLSGALPCLFVVVSCFTLAFDLVFGAAVLRWCVDFITYLIRFNLTYCGFVLYLIVCLVC